LLEDMVVTAANQALGQAKEISNTEMGKVTSGSACRINVSGMTHDTGRAQWRSANTNFHEARFAMLSPFAPAYLRGLTHWTTRHTMM